MRIKHVALVAFCLLVVCSVVLLADTLTLKDGTVLEGKVIPQGEKYWIKLADGSTRLVNKTDVKSWDKGDAKPTPAPGGAPTDVTKPTTPAKPTTPPPGAAPAAGGTVAMPAGVSVAFQTVKGKADRKETPIEALQLWDTFLESPNLSAADKEAATKEHEFYDKLNKDKAEKINGKWVGGEEKKKLMQKVKELVKEGNQLLNANQTLDGTKKLEEALKLYPRSFDANFELGYYYLSKGAVGSNGQGNVAFMNKAMTALETAAKILPESAATWSNLAIGYNFRKQYAKSVEVAYRAVKIRETKETVTNLIAAISYAPPGMRESNSVVKPIMEDAIQIAARHGVQIGHSGWLYVRPDQINTKQGGVEDPEVKAPPGAAWSGSGFFVTSDGYIITNHHVATMDPKAPIKKEITFRVRMDDGTEKPAKLIAVDDDADIAIMKIKSDTPLPYLKIADGNPNQAAKALVLGYPTTDQETPSMQISEGSVKSIHEGGDSEYHIWFDLNTTHGNSGGPIVDKHCRVIGILTAGWNPGGYNMWIVGGVGPTQIKKFLEKIGDKAPKVEYMAPPQGSVEFDGEKLTEQARKSTVWILAIRTEGSTSGEQSDSDKDKPAAGAEGEKPADPGDKPADGGAPAEGAKGKSGKGKATK